MKYFPQTISAAKEIEEERKQEESAKLKVDFNDDDDQLDESIRANHCVLVQEMEEEFGEDRLGRLRTRLWDLLEYPETSKVVALVICLRVLEGGYERQWGNYYC